MKGEQICIVPSEADSYRQRSRTIPFPTDLLFLKGHNGFRRKKMHLLIATSGAGKSTLVRTLVIDLIKNNPGKKILVYLSEETIEDFKFELSESSYDFSFTKNLFAISEQDFDEKDKLWDVLHAFVDENKIDILIFDNITTSKFYNDTTPDKQGRFSAILKHFAQVKNIPVIPIAHTAAGINNNTRCWINEDQIRGAKTIVNLSEFVYILQRFHIEGRIIQTFRIIKHRGQAPEHKTFKLTYSEQERIYIGSQTLNYTAIAEVFKNADRDR